MYGKIDIKFQGDSLSPLLFTIAFIPLSHLLQESGKGYQISPDVIINHLLYMDDIKLYARNDSELQCLCSVVYTYANDICMSFGLDKCKCITVHRGKLKDSDNIKLPSSEVIQQLVPGADYRYLGILESSSFKTNQMKDKLQTEYKRRIRKLLKSHLNAKNIIQAINTFAIPVLCYSGSLIKWSKEDLRCLDVLTRKQLTLHHAFHIKGDVDPLYISRKVGGRGLLSVTQVKKGTYPLTLLLLLKGCCS